MTANEDTRRDAASAIRAALDQNPNASRDELAAVLVDMLDRMGLLADRSALEGAAGLAEKLLGYFVHSGHPGTPCKRTGWIDVKHLDQHASQLHTIKAYL